MLKTLLYILKLIENSVQKFAIKDRFLWQGHVTSLVVVLAIVVVIRTVIGV